MQNQLSHPGGHQLHESNHVFSEEKVIGDIATIANMIMYISYIGEILQNLNGQPTYSFSLSVPRLTRHCGLPTVGSSQSGIGF